MNGWKSGILISRSKAAWSKAVRSKAARSKAARSKAARSKAAWTGLLVTLLIWVGMPEAPKAGEALIVAAASSLRSVFPDLKKIYRERNGEDLVIVFGSSGILARQMEHGAPYDLFLSANEDWVKYLVGKGLISSSSVRVYAHGRLVLVLRSSPVFRVNETELLGREGLAFLKTPAIRNISMANPSHAPYGMATREALERSGLWDQLQSKLVFGENVRQALSFVETGNADAGFIAESIARTSSLKWRRVEEKLHPPLRQTLGIRVESPNSQAAGKFVDLLLSREGGVILAKFGLLPTGEATSEGKP